MNKYVPLSAIAVMAAIQCVETFIVIPMHRKVNTSLLQTIDMKSAAIKIQADALEAADANLQSVQDALEALQADADKLRVADHKLKEETRKLMEVCARAGRL